MRRIDGNCSTFPVHTEYYWLRDLHFSGQKNDAVLWGRGRHGAGHPSNQKNILANASKHHSCQEPLLHERTVTRTVVPVFRHQIFPRPVGGMSQVKQKHFLSGQALNGLLRAPEQKAPQKKNSTKMKGKPPTPQCKCWAVKNF